MNNQFQYEKQSNSSNSRFITEDTGKQRKDEDLIIEENTVYEIDRECFERLKRQRKRKAQGKQNI